ncbi:sulfate/molybdate ABC transporter ATP-binding protein [Glaesserella sp.]|uniref:sulfate/molybdate ABC transporter ATP-binding protein n=1 Tax=Glaesserella sp. TaxID=2094731 RepID=UPI0035A07EBC
MSITIEHIQKTFDHFTALKDINFTVNKGELAALLGPSGCGKTTLLRIIAGLEQPTSGQIFFENCNVSALSAKDRDIGFVFQSYALFRHMTVAQNVAFGLKVKPRAQRLSDAEIDRKVRELLDLVQLNRFSSYYPDQLSGGQRQRVALARALAIQPKVLLLDEPFSALDATVRKELRRWLRDFHHEINVTSLFVTHDQDEALEVADKIIVMNKGQIEQIGTPDQVYKQPKTAFVAHFLGEVNALHGFVERNILKIGQFSQTLNQHYISQSAIAYVRPHEITLTKKAIDNSIRGEIIRIHTAGPTIFVEVAVKHNEKPIEVSVNHTQFEQEDFKLGEPVSLIPALVNVFLRDELIEFMI